MRTVFASIAFVLSLSLGTSAQDSNAQIKAAVRDVLVRQQDAWNRHDLEAFMSGYWNSPDLTFFSGANVTTSWQATLEVIANDIKARDMRWDSFSFRISK